MQHLIWRDESASTNDDLRELDVPEWGTVVTARQTAGRGRLGREWITPPDTSLAVSVRVPATGWRAPVSLAPLMVGSAMKKALAPLCETAVKWPNDVLLAGPEGGRKLCGILCELNGDSVIAGAGVNVLTAEADLPVPTATSLRAAGVDLGDAERLSDPAGRQLAEDLLERYLVALKQLTTLARTDPAELMRVIEGDSATIGSTVRVIGTAGGQIEGVATGLTTAGELRVQTFDDEEIIVSAGDVEHLR